MSKYSLAAIFLLLSCVAVSYTQALDQRPQKVAQLKYCGSILKSQFISRAQQYRPNTHIENSIQSMFPADRDKLVQGVIEGNSGKFQQSVKGKQGKYVASLGILGLFALLHIILVPILLVTRCCTRCSKLKFKKDDQSYTPCQLCWPGACIIFLLFALIGISGGILKVNRDFQPKYTDFKCSLGLITHNILEGGSYDKDNIHFNGLKYFRNQVQNFFQNVSAINTTVRANLSSKSKTMKTINHHASMALDMASQIPDQQRVPYNKMYQYQFFGEYKYDTPSTLSPILGDANTNGTLVGNLSNRIRQTNKTIQEIAQLGDNFDELMSRVDKEQVQRQVSDSIYKMQSVQFNIINTVGITQQGVLRAYTIGSYIVLGFTIFLAVLLCLGVICLAFWNSYPCRSKVCFCCGVLWIVGILHFLLAIAFTLANPAMVYGCQYARQGFGSQTGFTKNFGNISSGSQASKTISKCLSSSATPYYLYENILTDSVKANLSQLHQSFQTKFNSTQEREQFNKDYKTLLEIVQKYRTSQIIDLSQKEIENLKELSKTDECLPDSWVPSIHQEPQLVPCMNSTSDMPKVNNLTCPSREQFAKGGVGCVGCIDSSAMFQLFGFERYADDLYKLLYKRYPKCIQQQKKYLVDRLIQTFNSYYAYKNKDIGLVKSRATGVPFNANLMYNILQNQLEPNLKKVQNWFLTQPFLTQGNQSTMAKQMDCRVLGKGIDDTVNILCSEGIPFVYNLRFLYYATAVIIFLICCFSVCVMSRFYHQHNLKSFAPNEEKYRELKNVRLQPQAITDRRESVEEMVVNAHPYINH